MDKQLWLARARRARLRGRSIGLVQGSWDLFHIGHLKYLLRARALCDYLIVGMDSDDKIKKRKGETRPIIPENERREFIELLDLADDIVVKQVDEPKWGLIKAIGPDILICINENYSEDELQQLRDFCKEVKVLPRQATTSTSDKIRKITIKNGGQYRG